MWGNLCNRSCLRQADEQQVGKRPGTGKKEGGGKGVD